jgi:hypothetical protein
VADVDAALCRQVLDVPQHSGYLTYVITTSGITLGDELK